MDSPGGVSPFTRRGTFVKGCRKGKNMKTMIAIPCMDTVQTEFAASLIRLRPVGLVSPIFMPCSLIYKSRNDLTDTALKENFDYVL